MKKIIIAILSVTFLISCENEGPKDVKLDDNEKVVTSFANGAPQIVRELKKSDTGVESVYEKEYYEDGNILKEGPIDNNQRHGYWKTYYRNGNLWNEGYYDHGVRQDSITGYYPDGELKYIGVFDKGQKTGTWLFYDEQGKLKENKVYMKPGEKRETDIYIPAESK
jgi:antitoxin component YwqK of YwqJK toxin-antitoxin module